MKPIFTCKANGKDITKLLSDRFVRLVVTDESGIKSDTATFTLDNRDLQLPVPRHETKLEITLGYEQTETVFTGEYTVDEVEILGPPDVVEIRAKAMNMRGNMKSPRTKSYHQYTIKDIVTAIARANGYTAQVTEPLASVMIEHIDQTEESDMHFLTRLSLENDAVFKAANGFLLFRRHDDTSSFSGIKRPPVVMSRNGIIDYRYTSMDRSNFDVVRARWRDIAGNTDRFESAGAGERVYTLRHGYADAQQAKAAAASKLAALERGRASLEITTLGLPGAAAETDLLVNGFHPVIDGAEWVMKSVSHELSDSGFATRIRAEVKRK